jgi:hypothetical protein
MRRSPRRYALVIATLGLSGCGFVPPLAEPPQPDTFSARNRSVESVTVEIYQGEVRLFGEAVDPRDSFGFVVEDCQGTEIRVLNDRGRVVQSLARAACEGGVLVVTKEQRAYLRR